MDVAQQKYEAAKTKCKALLQQNQAATAQIERLKADFRTAFTTLVNIMFSSNCAQLADRASELRAKLDGIEIKLADAASVRSVNQRNYLNTNSCFTQTNVIQAQSCRIKMQTMERAIQTDEFYDNYVAQAEAQFNQLKADFDTFKQNSDERRAELQVQLAASQMEAQNAQKQVQAWQVCASECTVALQCFQSPSVLAGLLRTRDVIRRLDGVSANVTAYRRGVETQHQAFVLAIVKTCQAFACDVQNECKVVEERVVQLVDRVGVCAIAAEQLTEAHVRQLEKSQTLQQQRDQCVDELTALCTAVRGHAEREDQTRQRYDESTAKLQHRIATLDHELEQYVNALQHRNDQIQEYAQALDCEAPEIGDCILQLIESNKRLIVTAGYAKDSSNTRKSAGLVNEEILLELSAAKAGQIELQHATEQNRRELQDLNAVNAELQMKAASLQAQYENSAKECEMMQDQLQEYEKQLENTIQAFQKYKVAVEQGNLSQAVHKLAAMGNSVRGNISNDIALVFKDIRRELAVVQEQMLQSNVSLITGLAHIQEMQFSLAFAYEKKINYLQNALAKERRYSKTMIDCLLGLLKQIETLNTPENLTLCRRVETLQTRVQNIQITFVELTKAVVQLTTERQLLRTSNTP